jgi:tRNA(Ile2) C34 agmatinyltransferase TiaS
MARRVDALSLTPDGEPPTRSARWCPTCRRWLERSGRRCAKCGTAVVRPARRVRHQKGELRPGVIAEFEDPRDGTA